MLVSRLLASTQVVMETRKINAREALFRMHNYWRNEIVEVLPKEGE